MFCQTIFPWLFFPHWLKILTISFDAVWVDCISDLCKRPQYFPTLPLDNEPSLLGLKQVWFLFQWFPHNKVGRKTKVLLSFLMNIIFLLEIFQNSMSEYKHLFGFKMFGFLFWGSFLLLSFSLYFFYRAENSSLSHIHLHLRVLSKWMDCVNNEIFLLQTRL